MKMFVMCMWRQAELGHPSFEPFLADYFDEGVAYIECSLEGTKARYCYKA